jgi:cyclophilin family peptidyl-prolyl cis-trans isomerase
MSDGRSWWKLLGKGSSKRPAQRTCQRVARLEALEDRRILSVSVSPISDVTVPVLAPVPVVVNGTDTAGSLTYSASSSDPGVVPIVTASTNPTIDISTSAGDMTFQLYQDLVPQAVGSFLKLVNAGLYNQPNSDSPATFYRGVPSAAIQGGVDSPANQVAPYVAPSSPNFDDEFNPDLRFTTTAVLAMANAGPDTNSSEFFITDGSQREWDFRYTIIGIETSGDSVRQAIQAGAVSGSNDYLTTPVTINSITVVPSQTDVVLVTAPSPLAASPVAATITVTATDTTDASQTATQTFQATPAADTDPYAEAPPYIPTDPVAPSNFPKIPTGPITVDGAAATTVSTPVNTAVQFNINTVDLYNGSATTYLTGDITDAYAPGDAGSNTGWYFPVAGDSSSDVFSPDGETVQVTISYGSTTIGPFDYVTISPGTSPATGQITSTNNGVELYAVDTNGTDHTAALSAVPTSGATILITSVSGPSGTGGTAGLTFPTPGATSGISATVNSSGVVTVTPAAGTAAGVYGVAIGVSDASAPVTSTDSQVVPVLIDPAAPTVTLTNGDSASTSENDNSAGNPLIFSVSGVTAGYSVAVFADGTQIGSGVVPTGQTSVSITSTEAFTLSQSAHTITAIQTYTVTNAQVGNWYEASVALPSAAGSLSITVIAPNPPVFKSNTVPADVAPGWAVSGVVTATANSHAVQYSLTSGPAGASIDPNSGTLTWDIPASYPLGSVSFTVTATKGNSTAAPATDTFSVMVAGVGAGIGLYDPTTSIFYLRNTTTTGTADETVAFGVPGAGWLPIAGDWTGDGVDSIGLYDPATSTFYLRNANTTGVANITFGFGAPNAGWTPVVGDWNGSGKDSVGLYDSADGVLYWRNTTTTGGADGIYMYGDVTVGELPIAGQWNGGAKDSIGFYSSTTALVGLCSTNSSPQWSAYFGFGAPGTNEKPVTADWNNDGVTTLGVYNPASSLFYLRNSDSSGFADITLGFGAPGAGWLPLAGVWVGSANTLTATGGPAASPTDTAPLQASQLQPLVTAAIARWTAAGAPAAVTAAMAQAQVVITTLPAGILGETFGHTIDIDPTADGYGWFIDPTPNQNGTFSATATSQGYTAVNPAAADSIDLLTVVEHELGHVAGLSDLVAASPDIMNGQLGVGLRRLPSAADVDALFAQGGP